MLVSQLGLDRLIVWASQYLARSVELVSQSDLADWHVRSVSIRSDQLGYSVSQVWTDGMLDQSVLGQVSCVGQSVGSGQIDMLGHSVLGQVSWVVRSVGSGQIDILGHSVLGQVSCIDQSVGSGQIDMLGHSA